MLEEQPIVLPRLRDSVHLVVPRQPSEPPTDLDLATARTYFACMRTLREDGGLDDDRRPSQLEEVDSLRYLNDVRERIRITRGDPVQEILRRMEQRFDRMEQRMEQRLDSIEGRLEGMVRAQNLNLLGAHLSANRAADGVRTPFYIIPFRDGSLPTQPPHSLPALSNVDVIENLNAGQLREYCTGYGYPVGNPVQMRARIKTAIGKD
ncbi:hypothetical protein V1504DRAFT_465463 [Lipomyces starkeyi]